MDKNALIAVMISLAIWVGWQKYYLEPYQQHAVVEQQVQEAARKASLQQEQNKANIDSIGFAPKNILAAQGKLSIGKQTPVSSASLETDSYQMKLTNGPSLFDGWVLKNYYQSLQHKGDTINLKLVSGFNEQLRLRIAEENFTAFNESNWSDFSKTGKNSYTAHIQGPEISAERSVEAVDGSYYTNVNYRIKFANTPPKFIFFDLLGSPKRENDKEGSVFGQQPDKVKFTYRDTNSRQSVMAASLKETQESFAGIKWLGLDTKYFTMAIVPDKSLRNDSGIQIKHEYYQGNPVVRGSFVVPTNGKKEIEIPLRVYFGPKQLESLEKADSILSDAIDFGWTSAIAIPLLKALKWLYGFFGNYGIAIMVLTFIIKIILFPLMYKSMTSTAKMAKLQPQLNALREKYKDDKEKLNTEMMSFMKTNGYNPAGGCLPMLLQMPIFFALYRVFFNSIELYQAPFFAWIHDLSSPDPLFIAPVLLAGLMFVQQKISPATVTDPAQQKMMQFMPVMFGVFMLLLPAGLNMYMLVNSATTIMQQYLLNKKLGLGKFAKPVGAA